jgi:hypothetical protein
MKISTQQGTGPRIQPLPRPLRRIWLILHVICSVGWLGLLVGCLGLCLTALTSTDPELIGSLYVAGTVLADTFFLPATLLVLITGVVLGLGTKWGLVRFHWVLAKLVIAVVLVLAAEFFLKSRLSAAAASGTDNGLVGAFGVLVLMAGFATVLSVLKPWGRINWRRPTPAPVLQHQESP